MQLDSIRVHFSDTAGLFERLVDAEKPAITFQLLDLENFGLSDDLYIKMNARGKPLTPFETFKARYEQVLEEVFGNETREIGKQHLPVAEYFAWRMDTHWADFFWVHRDRKTNLYDDAVMNLFRSVALVTRDVERDDYLDNLKILRDRSLKPSFSFFYENGWLDRHFSEILFLLLEVWSADGQELARQLPDGRYYEESTLFTKAVTDPAAFRFMYIVQFFAYARFLQQHSGDVDPQAFQEWMRIIRNLSVNTVYDRPDEVQRSISGICKLIAHADNILAYFSKEEKPVRGFRTLQITEEQLKAKLILAHKEWRSLIDRAESHGYFKGQIEFLLDFSGVLDRWRNSQDVSWDDDIHVELQHRFDYYLARAEKMFTNRGLASAQEFRWERSLLSIGDYTLSKGLNKSFLLNPYTEPTSWKRLLRDAGEKRQLLKKLWDRLDVNLSIPDQLDTIIDQASELEPWREALVHTPESIEYCKKREFRVDGSSIYLMSKSQMNGMHAELFTYCLYHQSIKNLEGDEIYYWVRYKDVSGTEDEPHISLNYRSGTCSLIFQVKSSSEHFVISISRDSLAEKEDVKTILLEKLDFVESDWSFFKRIEGNRNVNESLQQLALTIKEACSEHEDDNA